MDPISPRNLPQDAVSGFGGHLRLREEEETGVDHFHSQFHHRARWEVLVAFSWEGKKRLG
jgi:hypothetical protein